MEIVKERLQICFSKHNLHEHQYRFMNNRLTIDAVFEVEHSVIINKVETVEHFPLTL